MKTQQRHSLAILAGVLFALTIANSVHAQKPMPTSPAVDPAAHVAHVAKDTDTPPAASSDPALTQQIAQLQAKLAQLEAVLAKNMPPMAGPPAAAPMPGMSDPAPPAMNMMGMMDKMMGMMDKMMSMGGGAPMPQGGSMPAGGGMGMDMMKLDPMPPAAPAPGMSMGMDMMGKTDRMGMGGRGMAAMPQSALPGYPGASHLYHTGATGFYLDHPEHISLTTDQQVSLNKAKEQALLTKSSSDRAIEQAEQALWTLTAADQPDAGKIEAKIREIEKLRGDERLAFIRSVGDASKVLTDEQRRILTGFAPPAPASSMATPAAPMPAMTDM